MGRLGYVPSLFCAEFVMGRVCHVPSLLWAELSLNLFTLFFLSRITMSLKIKDHKTASESMHSKRVCQERDVNISLINVIDSASRC